MSETVTTPFERKLNELEALMIDQPPAEHQIVNRFTPGLYIRECRMKAGTLLTSMEHRFEHPFVISKGKVQVVSESEGATIYEAPFCGITKPGTRRMIHVLEDTIWTTFHVTDLTDVEEIVRSVTVPPHNPLIPEGHPNSEQWRKPQPVLSS